MANESRSPSPTRRCLTRKSQEIILVIPCPRTHTQGRRNSSSTSTQRRRNRYLMCEMENRSSSRSSSSTERPSTQPNTDADSNSHEITPTERDVQSTPSTRRKGRRKKGSTPEQEPETESPKKRLSTQPYTYVDSYSHEIIPIIRDVPPTPPTPPTHTPGTRKRPFTPIQGRRTPNLKMEKESELATKRGSTQSTTNADSNTRQSNQMIRDRPNTPTPSRINRLSTLAQGRRNPNIPLRRLRLGNNEVYISCCPNCFQSSMTRIEFAPTCRTHLIAGLLCLVGCWCCACMPYLVESCVNVKHYCGYCDYYLGTYTRSGIVQN